jgi:prevent-host-death family protein
MEVISMHQAKSTLSQLVKRAAGGDIVLIGGYGRPEVALVPATSVKRERKIGILAGKLDVPEDFDAPLPVDMLQAFESDV